MPTPKIKTASQGEIDQCVALIVLAFSNDPAARWLYPDPHAFLKHFPNFVRTFAGRAFEQSSAYYIDGSAAALWFQPGAQPDEEALVALIKDSVPACDQDVAFAVLEQMDEAHPEEPHWYLPLIGTDPTQQGNGFGSALLDHTLAISAISRTYPPIWRRRAQGTSGYISGTVLSCSAPSRLADHRQSPQCSESPYDMGVLGHRSQGMQCIWGWRGMIDPGVVTTCDVLFSLTAPSPLSALSGHGKPDFRF